MALEIVVKTAEYKYLHDGGHWVFFNRLMVVL